MQNGDVIIRVVVSAQVSFVLLSISMVEGRGEYNEDDQTSRCGKFFLHPMDSLRPPTF
jgi:hypothetical protein